MRPERVYQEAIRLIEFGINDSEIGRRLEIPRATVRDWRVGRAVGSSGRTRHWSGKRNPKPCFQCVGGHLDEEVYAYLLGAYLGDGCLSPMPRGVFRLRIACDQRYTGIIHEIATSIAIVRGVEIVGFVQGGGYVEVSSYWKHWPCLFPQHGPGRKHERRIELTPWQKEIVARHPKKLVRGLIHSDGNRHINEVERVLLSGSKMYRYPRYMFTNASTDILGIFTDALDLLGIHWTQTTGRDISIARRHDVAFVDTFVGPKS